MRHLLLALAIWAAWLPRAAPVLAADQTSGGLAVDLYVDRAQNKDFIENQEVEGFVYDMADGKVHLDDDGIMSVWKGDGTIERFVQGAFMGRFEDTAQFAPVFLVVDVTNQEARAAQIVGAFIEVTESAVDREPYLELFAEFNPDCGPLGDTVFVPDFEFQNFGWGAVEGATLHYTFGTDAGPKSRPFEANLGTFDKSKDVSVLQDLQGLGVDINQVKAGTFECPSQTQLAQCTAELAGSGLLGELENAVFPLDTYLVTRASGTLDYVWTDSKGAAHPRSARFFIDIPLLQFKTDGGPECGAGGPVERQYDTVKLPLDQQNYRIPLGYRGQLGPGENRRLGLSLVADKSSDHVFRVVFELADGTTAASPEIDLLYFMPRLPYSN